MTDPTLKTSAHIPPDQGNVRTRMAVNATPRAEDIAHVEGDAADDDALRQAGIDRARALIAVTPTDAINTFIVLTARGLCPNLFIVARADSVQNEAKLYRAGASKVVSPHIRGGRWMGMTAVNPAVTEFITALTEIDHANFVLHEFRLDEETPFVGQPFGEAADRFGLVDPVVLVAHGRPCFTYENSLLI